MKVTEIEVPTHDIVYRLEDPDGFLAIHRRRLGTAFGGTRIKRYDNRDEALADALRLSRAMTYKCAINDLAGAGGKAVLMEPSPDQRDAAVAALGDFIQKLAGRFITGPDLGFTSHDLTVLRRQTSFAVHQDLSHYASQSVIQAIRGALEALLGEASLAGRTVAVQGLGAVGAGLARSLVEGGARVIVADIDDARAHAVGSATGAEVTTPDAILTTECDVLAPCAVGGVVTAALVPALRCRVLCGGANNILDDDATAALLHERSIVFVPDFLSNSGGAIQGVRQVVNGPGDYINAVMAVQERTRLLVVAAREAHRSPLDLALARVGA